MTKVDERAVVPPVDAAARARLARALDREGVVAASLVGSQATGRAGPLSDVDVAVWLDAALDPPARLHLQLALASAAAEALGTGEVDVIVLDDAPPLVRQRAMASAIRLVDRDPRERVRRETAALVEYLDTIPLRATLDAGLRRRLAEGRFGRR
jgi:predicted nucleotidyltransferase